MFLMSATVVNWFLLDGGVLGWSVFKLICMFRCLSTIQHPECVYSSETLSTVPAPFLSIPPHPSLQPSMCMPDLNPPETSLRALTVDLLAGDTLNVDHPLPAVHLHHLTLTTLRFTQFQNKGTRMFQTSVMVKGQSGCCLSMDVCIKKHHCQKRIPVHVMDKGPNMSM